MRDKILRSLLATSCVPSTGTHARHACATHLLSRSGNEGPKTKEPSKYIRYIFNRIILENATVRAAAVSSLASFGANVEFLRPRVVTLLQRALSDNDDEVRAGWGWRSHLGLVGK
jgi:hypothetical protein